LDFQNRSEFRLSDFFPNTGLKTSRARVARGYFFKPKIQIGVKNGGPWNGKCWYILWSFGIFYSHLEYFTAIWYILRPFGNVVAIWYIFPLLVYCVKKNLATQLLIPTTQITFLQNFEPRIFLNKVLGKKCK
jgi:hypothetical protein